MCVFLPLRSAEIRILPPQAPSSSIGCLCGNPGVGFQQLNISCGSCGTQQHLRCMGLPNNTSTYSCAACRARDFDPFLVPVAAASANRFSYVDNALALRPVEPIHTGRLGSALVGSMQRRQAVLELSITEQQLKILSWYAKQQPKPTFVVRLSSFLGAPRKALANHRWPLTPHATLNGVALELKHWPPMWDGRTTNDRNLDLPLEIPTSCLLLGRNRLVFSCCDPEPHVLVVELLSRLTLEQIKAEVLAKQTLAPDVAMAHVRASFDRMGGALLGDDDVQVGMRPKRIYICVYIYI